THRFRWLSYRLLGRLLIHRRWWLQNPLRQLLMRHRRIRRRTTSAYHQRRIAHRRRDATPHKRTASEMATPPCHNRFHRCREKFPTIQTRKASSEEIESNGPTKTRPFVQPGSLRRQAKLAASQNASSANAGQSAISFSHNSGTIAAGRNLLQQPVRHANIAH